MLSNHPINHHIMSSSLLSTSSSPHSLYPSTTYNNSTSTGSNTNLNNQSNSTLIMKSQPQSLPSFDTFTKHINQLYLPNLNHKPTSTTSSHSNHLNLQSSQNLSVRSCSNCGNTQTRQWVRGHAQAWLCHSCGQFWRKNGYPRPKSLWNRPTFKRTSRKKNIVNCLQPQQKITKPQSISTHHQHTQSQSHHLPTQSSNQHNNNYSSSVSTWSFLNGKMMVLHDQLQQRKGDINDDQQQQHDHSSTTTTTTVTGTTSNQQQQVLNYPPTSTNGHYLQHENRRIEFNSSSSPSSGLIRLPPLASLTSCVTEMK